ncbi:MAG: hypothetical protein ASARMPRED_008710 [Alectoria sarmentosa]|nr:MAG: hypothetical protein ASARMPRED_008710 [Alectoria sarmentosa]
MAPTTQSRPVRRLYPSPKEDVDAYLAAIRLASSVRNLMDAQKAAVDGQGIAANADSYGRHHPVFPPAPSASLTPVPILNQTSSANLTSNTTKPGFVHPRSIQPSSTRYVITANTSISATLEFLKQHHGHLPPSDPPMGFGIGPVIEGAAAATPADVKPGPPMTTEAASKAAKLNHRHMLVPNSGVPPQCQPYAANADVNNDTLAVRPFVANHSTNSTLDLASRQLHSRNVSDSPVLAIRDAAICDAPTGFDERIACGLNDWWLVIAFFVLFFVVGFSWTIKRKYASRKVDEEDGNPTWPRLSNDLSTTSSEARPKPRVSKVYTNRAAAKLKQKVRRAQEEDGGLDEELSTRQYEAVAWRSPSFRGARANGKESVEHDARPIGGMPELTAEPPNYCTFELLGPDYEGI